MKKEQFSQYNKTVLLMRRTRFELAAFWSVARRSIQLSYQRTSWYMVNIHQFAKFVKR